MIETSKKYRPFPVVRDVDCMISFSVMDTSAKSDGTVIDESEAGVFRNIGTVLDGVRQPQGCYISLERNLWALDGEFEPLPDNAESVNTGWWSDTLLSDTETSSPVSVRFDFADDISTLGWTLYFDSLAGIYPDRIGITAYSAGGAVLDEGVYDNDSAVFSLQHYLGGYRAVKFDFLSVPGRFSRRVRLLEVDFGITKHYDRNSIGRVSMTYGADILSRSLPARELIFTFDNSDKQYNLLNPDGVYQHLQEGQRIEVKMSVGGEAVDMGEFRFTSADVSRSGIVPEITAHDALYSLDGSEFTGGTGAEMTLSQAVAAVLGDYELECAFDGGSDSRKVLLAPPSGSSARETIRLLAQAAMCAVYIDRLGVLRFTQLSPSSAADGSITADELYDYSGVSISEPADGVSLNASGEYRLDSDGKQIQYIYTAGSQGVGSLVQTFSNPCVAPSMGSAVASWLLAGLKMRKQYAVKNRCDPAVEIGDTVKIDDIFANRENAVVTGIEISYDGTLSAVTKGVGV